MARFGSVLLAVCVLLGAGEVHAATPVEIHGSLAIKGKAMVDASGQPVVLRGMSLFWSGWAGQFYNRRAVHWLAHDWKTSVIRAAVGVDNYMPLSAPTPTCDERRRLVRWIDLGAP